MACVLTAVMCIAGWAAENTLTNKERADGWKLLFDGKTLSGWKTSPTKRNWRIDNGTLVPVQGTSGTLSTIEQYGDFLLSVDFKEGKDANSGVFLRVPTQPTNGCRGIECQIYHLKTDPPTKNSCGAIYDAVAPSKYMCKGPGVWQNMRIECRGSIIKVTLNGTLVSAINLDEWTVPGQAPDGLPNKFSVAYKDMPRIGHVALQSHNSQVWFRNIKIKALAKSRK